MAPPSRASLAACLLPMLLAACTNSDDEVAQGDPLACEEGKCDTWGEDDRYEPYEIQTTWIRNAARAVGALVDDSELIVDKNGAATLSSTVMSHRNRHGLCEDVEYGAQPALAYCSGFFAGNDIFVTAGHCLTRWRLASDTCATTSIVFDFAYSQKPSDPRAAVEKISAENLYHCKEVLLAEYEEGPYYSNDMAVIRLDRPVKNRTPLRFRHSGAIQVGERVMQIGHPSGLPLKISRNGVVKESVYTGQRNYRKLQSEKGIFFDLEMFGGNSGGPTLNARYRWVEGVAHAYSGQNFVARKSDGGPACMVYGVCGVNATCPYYPGAYPITEYAERISAWAHGRTPPPPAPPDAGSPN